MKRYLLSFVNNKTGETKEYYKMINDDQDIRIISLELINTFNLDKSITRVLIYELKDIIYENDNLQ